MEMNFLVVKGNNFCCQGIVMGIKKLDKLVVMVILGDFSMETLDFFKKIP